MVRSGGVIGEVTLPFEVEQAGIAGEYLQLPFSIDFVSHNTKHLFQISHLHLEHWYLHLMRTLG